jgi:hypothetical protein
MPLLPTRKRDLRHLCLMAIQMEDIEMDSRQQQLLEEQQQCLEDPHLVKTELQVCTKVTVSLHFYFSDSMLRQMAAFGDHLPAGVARSERKWRTIHYRRVT